MPLQDALALRSAVELAELLHKRQVSSRELTDLYLDRIARYNPSLNAVVTLDADYARGRAARRTRRPRAVRLGVRCMACR